MGKEKQDFDIFPLRNRNLEEGEGKNPMTTNSLLWLR